MSTAASAVVDIATTNTMATTATIAAAWRLADSPTRTKFLVLVLVAGIVLPAAQRLVRRRARDHAVARPPSQPQPGRFSRQDDARTARGASLVARRAGGPERAGRARDRSA